MNLQKFLSISFEQPLGERVADGGYHLDLRVKAAAPEWPPQELVPLDERVWVLVCQWGLGAYEQFVNTGDEQWLAGARAAGDHILSQMTPDGGLTHAFAYPDTYDIPAGWMSAMAQGQAASLLVRLHQTTRDERYAEAAVRALAPIDVPVAQGGVGRAWRGGWFPEEYPTEPGSYVLNGALFAVFGMHDVADVLGDGRARERFTATAQLLAANLDAWDLGWWTTYDLFGFRVRNIASRAYQELHVTQLQALDRVAPDPVLRAAAQEFERQLAGRARATRATAAKIAFRLAVPRR